MIVISGIDEDLEVISVNKENKEQEIIKSVSKNNIVLRMLERDTMKIEIQLRLKEGKKENLKVFLVPYNNVFGSSLDLKIGLLSHHQLTNEDLSSYNEESLINLTIEGEFNIN